MRKLILRFFTVAVMAMSATMLAASDNEIIQIVKTKGGVIRPRTATIPITAYYDSQTKYVTICSRDHTQLVYYDIYFISSDVRVEGIMDDCLTTRISVGDQTGLCVLTFRLDDGAEYEGTILL